MDDGDEQLEYSVGTKCLILSFEEKNNYESIAFFDYDDEGKICRMTTTTNPRYHFSIQMPPLENDELN